MSRAKQAARRGLVSALLVVVSSVTLVTSAESFGNNRYVTRSCGTNWIGSDGNAIHASARTREASGSCAGPVGAGLKLSSSSVIWDWDALDAYQSGDPYDMSGYHTGCPSCNITLS